MSSDNTSDVDDDAAIEIVGFSALALSADTNPTVDLSWSIDGATPTSQSLSWSGSSIDLPPTARAFTPKNWAAPKQIFVIGNSLSDSTDVSNLWSQLLAAQREVGLFSVARYGSDIRQIYRAGVEPINLTVADDALPAGGTSASITAINGAAPDGGAMSFLNAGTDDLTTGVSMAGTIVDGAVTLHVVVSIPNTTSTDYSIVQDAGQDAITLSGPVLFIPDVSRQLAASDVIIWLGNNYFYSSVSNTYDDYTNPVFWVDLAKLIDGAEHNRVLLLPVLPDASWATTGTGNPYAAMEAANARTASLYPGLIAKSADGRSLLQYLQDQGDGSSNDNADIAAGFVPRSLRSDSLSLNALGNSNVATFVAEALAAQALPPAVTQTTVFTLTAAASETTSDLAVAPVRRSSASLPLDSAATKDELRAYGVNSLCLAQGDMTSLQSTGGQASDDLPHGAIVPAGTPGAGSYFNWATNPGTQHGLAVPDGWTAATTWFQVYTAVNNGLGRSDTNTRIAARNLQLWIKQTSTGQWYLAEHSISPAGAGYPEDFQTDVNPPIALDKRLVPGGGTSARMVTGRCFHGYDVNGRVLIPVGDIAAVYSCVEIKMEVDDVSLAPDFDKAHYVAACGADYWQYLEGDNTTSGGVFANGIYCGRHKIVTTDWQIFSGCTMAPSDMTSDNMPAVVYGTLTEATTLAYQVQGRSLKSSDLYNNLTTTTAGRALDARAGKTLNDSISTLTTQVSALGAAGTVNLHDGAPALADVASFNGQTVYAYASTGPMPFVLPATSTGVIDFNLVQMGAQPIVFLADGTAAILSVVGSAAQTNGQYSIARVRLVRNPGGSTAQWMVSGTITTAASTPARLWTPYQYGKAAADFWVDAQDGSGMLVTASKVSQLLDKSQNGRDLYQSTGSLQPTLVSSGLGSLPALTATITAPAAMSWTPAALPVATDLRYDGGAYLTLTAGTTISYTSATSGVAEIVLYVYTPTSGAVYVNGNDTAKNVSSTSFGGYGAVLVVHKPTSTGQSALGRVFSGTDKTIMNTSAGARGYDGAIGEILTMTGSSSLDFTTLANRRLLSGYAAARWGLQSLLPSGHPYKVNPPTF